MAMFDFSGAVLPSGVTLARAGPARRLNAAGVLVRELANVARFDYSSTGALRGLMVEGPGANLAPASQTFDNATYWTAAGSGGSSAPVLTTGYASPDGNNGGYQIAFGAAPAGQYSLLSSAATIALTAGSNAVSIWAMSAGAGGETIYLSLTMGGTVYTMPIVLTGTMRRYSAVFNIAASGNYTLVLGPDGRDAARVAASAVTARIWGVQVEQGGAASSYVTNGTTATGTRALDTLTIPFGAVGYPNGNLPIGIQFDDGSISYLTATVAGGTWQMVGGGYARAIVRKIYSTVQPTPPSGRSVLLGERGARAATIKA